jgi:fumarate hydratase, class I
MSNIRDAVLELVRLCSTDLPKDVEQAMVKACAREQKGSLAKKILGEMIENTSIARAGSVPICQDTGTPIFYVDCPVDMLQSNINKAIVSAVKSATSKNLLRPNSVDSVTGQNSGNNIGPGHPEIFYNQWTRKSLRIRLMLKGGGSENVGMQYSLPNTDLDAHRDLDGVKRCVIDTVFRAQGKGCAPGIIGVGIGGDRGSSYFLSKKQFFTKLDEKNPVEQLNRMENELKTKLNKLAIGPMGLGGKTTVLGVKIGAENRIPASFFVSVSYMCWACRRRTLIFNNGKAKYD